MDAEISVGWIKGSEWEGGTVSVSQSPACCSPSSPGLLSSVSFSMRLLCKMYRPGRKGQLPRVSGAWVGKGWEFSSISGPSAATLEPAELWSVGIMLLIYSKDCSYYSNADFSASLSDCNPDTRHSKLILRISCHSVV